VVKNIYEVLRQKEIDCARVQAEIEALRMVIPLVDGESASTEEPDAAQQEGESNQGTGTDGPTFAELGKKNPSSFWRRVRTTTA